MATMSPTEVPTAKQVEPKRIASSFDWSQWWLEPGVVIGGMLVVVELSGQNALPEKDMNCF